MLPFLPFIVPFFKTNVLKIVGVLGVVLIIGFGYYQYKSNIKLQAQNYNLQATVVQTQARMDTILADAEKIVTINAGLVKNERELNQALFDLTHKFSKNGRDFKNLARRKPGLIAPIINKATKETFRCIEKTTMGEECVTE